MPQVEVACPCLIYLLWKPLAMCLFSEKGRGHASSFLPHALWQIVLGSGSQEDLGKDMEMGYIIVPFQ